MTWENVCTIRKRKGPKLHIARSKQLKELTQNGNCGGLSGEM